MAKPQITKTKDKLTDAEKKKVKQDNKAKANPGKAEEKKRKTTISVPVVPLLVLKRLSLKINTQL